MKAAMYFAWLILVVAVIHVHCQEDEMDEERSEEYRQCNKERRRVLVSLKKNMEVCASEKTVEGSSCDPAVRNCLVKCLMEKENMLDENGIMTVEWVKTAIENRASEEMQELFIKLLEVCITEHGEELKPDDLACSGYEVFGHCLERGIEKICEDPADEVTSVAETPKEEL